MSRAPMKVNPDDNMQPEVGLAWIDGIMSRCQNADATVSPETLIVLRPDEWPIMADIRKKMNWMVEQKAKRAGRAG